ncbi:hypothetical protein HZS_1366, partial [Henneguya salminicola]
MAKYNFVGPNVEYLPDRIVSDYLYATTEIITEKSPDGSNKKYFIKPIYHRLQIETARDIPKLGVMLVGLGGNNGSSFAAVLMANKLNLSWKTKQGVKFSNYLGSIVKSSTVVLGVSTDGSKKERVCAPVQELLPFIDPNNIEIDGWDINKADLGECMSRAQVIDINLQELLYPAMKSIVPRPSVYDPDYISSSQMERGDNVIEGTLEQQLNRVREDIRDFKKKKNLDKVIVMWTASTEKNVDLNAYAHNDVEILFKAINNNQRYLVSPSNIFAIASILEGCAFINGAPQNTIVNAIKKLAKRHNILLAGNDFKTGQTKVKSALVEYLIGSGFKPVSIVSYNHLGNNDGKNLHSPEQFLSKEVTKSRMVDDIIQLNETLYHGELIDHSVALQYVPYVGDSKRAFDEYTSEICMQAVNTMVVYNVCEDSLLAVPVMLDLILFTELFSRIRIRCEGDESGSYRSFQTILSALGFFLKAPLMTEGELTRTGLASQKTCLENLVRACIGLPPDSHLNLEYRFGFKSE